MNLYNIAIVEDDDNDKARVEQALGQYATEHGLEFKLHFFKYAELLLDSFKKIYDVVFMDIELPGMDGMTAAKRLREMDNDIPLIFLTNAGQYAIKGYEVRAMDYVLKPATFYSISMRMDNVIKLLSTQKQARVTINLREGVRVLLVNDIFYIEIMKHDIIFHTVNGEVHAYGNLNERERELTPYGFARCSACMLVNLKYVEGVYNEDVVVNGTVVHMSRGKKKAFMQSVSDYLGLGG